MFANINKVNIDINWLLHHSSGEGTSLGGRVVCPVRRAASAGRRRSCCWPSGQPPACCSAGDTDPSSASVRLDEMRAVVKKMNPGDRLQSTEDQQSGLTEFE